MSLPGGLPGGAGDLDEVKRELDEVKRDTGLTKQKLQEFEAQVLRNYDKLQKDVTASFERVRLVPV